MTTRRQPEATVLPVHFEDRSGAEFERLCFGYVFDWKAMAVLLTSRGGRRERFR